MVRMIDGIIASDSHLLLLTLAFQFFSIVLTQKPIGLVGIAHGDVEDSVPWMQRLMLSCRVSEYLGI
jgi:hypothetical protein